jgi:hypothetical protein
VAYHNSFHNPFIFDDHGNIVENVLVRQPLTNWRQLLASDRWLATLTLAGNYALGGLDVRGYHAVNLAIHLLAGLVLYDLVRRTLLLPGLAPRFGRGAPELALAVALLWLVHPLQTESVTYIIQRSESLMGLFYLLTLYCLLRGTTARRGLPWYVGAVLCCGLGMGSKQVMVTAPLLALLYDRAFLALSWGTLCRRRWGLYLALAATEGLLAGSVGGAFQVAEAPRAAAVAEVPAPAGTSGGAPRRLPGVRGGSVPASAWRRSRPASTPAASRG